MAVYSAAFSVIVRNSTIEARFPGGMDAFGLSRPNETFCTDGKIGRVGFMVEKDARTFIAQLVAAGIVPSENETAAEIVLIVQGKEFLYPCDWLQVGLFDGRLAAWLAGTDRGNLFISQSEAEASTPLQAISNEELRASYEFLGMKDKLGVYRHKTTRQLMYIARPFHPARPRKWWQFWK